MQTAKLTLGEQTFELPTLEGTEQELAIDISALRAKTGYITLDPGYGNTGSCKSEITFIDGERGILRYRGYDIEELASKATFPEVCYLLIYDKLPNLQEREVWRRQLTQHSLVHESMLNFFQHFPPTAHPMDVLSAMVAALPAFYPDENDIHLDIIRLLAKTKTLVAIAYKKSIGEPIVYPKSDYSYMANFLRMMFATPAEPYVFSKTMEDALNLLLIIHADHEQNCSTSTVRMVGSSHASVYASISAGISALSGPLHGGANQEVLEMLEAIRKEGSATQKYIAKAKDKNDGFRLMGFGHRVYKNFDPRAKLLKKSCDAVLAELKIDDPLLNIAKELEEAALQDSYFVERKLFPNVDFYSGILYRALGIPTNMFTVMFALGRMPGWIAHWKEMRDNPQERIHRPRQLYVGNPRRPFPPMTERK